MKQKLQNQTQQVQQNKVEGGVAMKQETQAQAQAQQSQIYFVTFPTRLSKEKARQILNELRNRYSGIAVFTPKLVPGRRVLVNIEDVVVIVTFPYVKKDSEEAPTQAHTQAHSQAHSQGGFTIRELLRNKI